MSPSELEQFLETDPLPNIRLILASGDHMIVTPDDRPFVVGLTLILRGNRESQSVTMESKVISVPNIVFAETTSARQRFGGRRRLP